MYCEKIVQLIYANINKDANKRGSNFFRCLARAKICYGVIRKKKIGEGEKIYTAWGERVLSHDESLNTFVGNF